MYALAIQVVLKKAHNFEEIAPLVNGKIVEFANRGYRALGVAKAANDGAPGVAACTTKSESQALHAMPVNLVTNVWRFHRYMERTNGITILSERQRSVAADNQSRFPQ